MKKISLISLVCAITFLSFHADAKSAYGNNKFKKEVQQGLDVVSVKYTAHISKDEAPGQLGLEVYETATSGKSEYYGIYIPTSMYVRAGAGLNLGFISDKANAGAKELEMSGSWSTQMGLGWNLSSYVRTEIDFQTNTFKFSKSDDALGAARSLGATLYFDFARRFVTRGDIIKRRTFVPFMGLGFAAGAYSFEGINGKDGIFVAPRAVLGVNFMFTDIIGMDLAYQYQMFTGSGFGWDTRNGGTTSLSDIMLSLRFNF